MEGRVGAEAGVETHEAGLDNRRRGYAVNCMHILRFEDFFVIIWIAGGVVLLNSRAFFSSGRSFGL